MRYAQATHEQQGLAASYTVLFVQYESAEACIASTAESEVIAPPDLTFQGTDSGFIIGFVSTLSDPASIPRDTYLIEWVVYFKPDPVMLRNRASIHTVASLSRTLA